MLNRKPLYAVAAILIVAMAFFYKLYISPTKIATLNFPDFSVEKFIRSNNNPFVSIESVSMDEPQNIKDYDMVLVRVHGSSMDSSHLKAIEEAIAAGVPIFSTESDNAKINTLQGQELKYLATLEENGSVRNNQSLFNYIRKQIDGKKFFNKTYGEPVIIPSDYFFHLGDDNFFSSFEEYQTFYEKAGKYKKDAPRIVMLSGNINLQNSNEDHLAALINTLESKGLNVYPIKSFGMKKLQMIKEVKPNLIINNPHGRLIMGGADKGEALLRELNIPILAPVTVSTPYDEWLKSKQGMEQGGLTSMSVVLPELDGATTPYAIAAQFERNGYHIFDAIPGHTEKFCSLVKNYTTLQTKENADKRIAIYYYKGVGKGAVNASEIEGVQSLFNTLKLLKQNGYKVENLPTSAKDLEVMIQKQGAVLGSYALGAYDTFLREGNPALVSVEEFAKWSKQALPEDLIKAMKAQYGEAPGKYMAHEEAGKKSIAVARLQFGNVAILPQPMVSTGKDIEELTHGVEGAVAYPYVASYLWTRFGFEADALLHFGTHGSLEFIPGKQLALSDHDWTDALVGDMPHLYIYTINNIGEGIIAKRRSYATLIDHLTAPFMQGELYGELEKLKSTIHRYEHLEEGSVKQAYRKTLFKLAQSQNIFEALGIDSLKPLDDATIEKIHIYVEEIDEAKVTDGLYILGEAYNKENADNTVRLMMQDPIRYALATIDLSHGHITADKLDNLSFITHRYTARTKQILDRALRGESGSELFQTLVSKADKDTLRNAQEREKTKNEAFAKRMRMMMSAMEENPTLEKFLDENGVIIERDSTILGKKKGGHPSWIPKIGTRPAATIKAESTKQPSMMDKMAASKSMQKSKKERADADLISALKTLEETLNTIAIKHKELTTSTLAEQEALLRALNGGYILPSSGGDPIVNPNAIATGRNFYSINPETTPSPEAWKVGKQLADNLLAQELTTKGKYPEKISFTLWSIDFISNEGATVAQILWLLGVEPLRDGMGYIRSLRVVSAEELGRPRIDVVVQTSGQLRDIAASRLALINRAVGMAAEAEDGDANENYVRKGFKDAERLLLEKGYSPSDARLYSRERIFGGAKGNYGTGIMGMVEDSENWNSQEEIAKQYIENMGAIYSSNGGEAWGAMQKGVFEAALLNTTVVVQPRSSNTWGPLSLDHVYEFMGGMSAAVHQVTDEDPTAYFNDYRNPNRAKVQGLKEAIGVETNSTIFNPKFITEKMKGEASSYGSFAETVRNTFGWNAMKPSAIDKHIWDEYHEIYVRDRYDLDIEERFADKNPYALQEITAVMLESARKGMWKASEQQIAELSELHTKMVVKHDAACSGFVCDNAPLRAFIAQHDPQHAADYQAAISKTREISLDKEQTDKSLTLKKEEQKQQKNSQAQATEETKDHTTLYAVALLSALFIAWLVYRRLKK